MRPTLRRTLLGAMLLAGNIAAAADHSDSPAALADSDADLADVYAWITPDGKFVNLVMTWFPNAPADSKLTDAVQFVFHLSSQEKFGGTPTSSELLCTFEGANAGDQTLKCWLSEGSEVKDFVEGPVGLPQVSDSSKLIVFGGVRNDPFFFNIQGFLKTVSTVKSAAASLTFDPAGCPQLDDATSNALVNQLKSNEAGAPGTDNFAGKNVHVISARIDKELVTRGGPILGVWASTHRK